MIDSFRCISKTRINRKVGEVSLEFYDKINDKILSEYFKKQLLDMKNFKKDYDRVLEKNINDKEIDSLRI